MHAGSVAVELSPGHAVDDPDGETLADDLGIDSLAIDAVCDLGELVADGSAVGLDRRRDVDAEDSRPQAPEAPQRPEAAAAGGGGRDRAAPVRFDPELGCSQSERVPVGGERDRRALQRSGPGGEQAHRLVFGHPADIDTRDRGAGGELGPRAREGEPEDDRDHAKDHRQKDGPA